MINNACSKSSNNIVTLEQRGVLSFFELFIFISTFREILDSTNDLEDLVKVEFLFKGGIK